ncbi:MAG: tetratricopeptide repeat protein [Spirochaetaceae bacterium]|jgi:hypothetical protein|nr:tetratricopeptide repeat protein [Spirochaetaceae bacterium]
MPSLEALAKFRAAFRSIGNEVTLSAQQKLPMEDLDLPESEPVARQKKPESGPSETAAPPADSQNKNEFNTDSDYFDFEDFSDLLPSDINHLEDVPQVEISEPENQNPDAPAAEDIQPSALDAEIPTVDELADADIPEAEIPEIDDADLPTVDELADPDIPEAEIPEIDDADFPNAEDLELSDTEIPSVEDLGKDADGSDLEEPAAELPEDLDIPEAEIPAAEDLDIPEAETPAAEDADFPNAADLELSDTEIPSVEDLGKDADGSDLEEPAAELPEDLDIPEAEIPAAEDLDIPEAEVPEAEEADLPDAADAEIPAAENLDIPAAENPAESEPEKPAEEPQPESAQNGPPEEPQPEEAEQEKPAAQTAENPETPEAEETLSAQNIPETPDPAASAAEIPPPDVDAEASAADFENSETPSAQNIPETPDPAAADAEIPAAENPAESEPENPAEEPQPEEAEQEKPAAQTAENPETPEAEDVFTGDIKIPDVGSEDASAPADDGFSLDAFDSFKMKGENAPSPDDELEKYALNVDDDINFFSHEEVEEIQLSNEEVNRLQKTIAGYPLNLRVACEQIIAEEAVDPVLMAKFIKALSHGAPMSEAASLAGKILERSIPIPKGFEKKTGEALQAERASFGYIFIHKFIPAFRLFILVALVAASLGYLIHRFVYTPLYADSIYQKGYERILAGEYIRGNERFNEALQLHRKKKWFYQYAEAFRDSRQYIFAREKYDLLLLNYPRDKKGVMDYAAMETDLSNYKKADNLLRRNILDYTVDDKDALLAVGDNALAWGDIEPEQYEAARQAFARLLERYGYSAPVLERMLKYFIRIDDLKEVLPLQRYFMGDPKNKIAPKKISSESLAELGGYLLDKKFEDTGGVPNEFISRIDGIRDVLIRSINEDPTLPESHYHLARYYRHFKNPQDEQVTLENAVRFFDKASEESVRRLKMRIDAEQRYAQVLTGNKEFFNAENHLKKGIDLYEDALNRRLITQSAEFGQLYANMGDLEYFTKDGNMGTALEYYARAEHNGWSPPEMQYRMGSAYYHQGKWADALERFVDASAYMPFNRRLLNALGNASYLRGDYDIAQGYYSHLLAVLDADRERFPVLFPHDRQDHMELAERLMMVRNNFGVTLEALTERTGNSAHRSQALGLYSDSARTWDAITRDPQTMIRLRPGELPGPGVNLGYLNAQNALHPVSDYERKIYPQIDKDVLEPSPWETLTPQNFRLSDTLF